MTSEPYCGVVKKEVNESIKDMRQEIRQELAEHRTTLSMILQKLAVLTAHTPPCEEMRERITRLEKTKSFLQGGWAVGAMIACAAIAVGSLIARLVLK